MKEQPHEARQQNDHEVARIRGDRRGALLDKETIAKKSAADPGGERECKQPDDIVAAPESDQCPGDSENERGGQVEQDGYLKMLLYQGEYPSANFHHAIIAAGPLSQAGPAGLPAGPACSH